MRRVCLIIIFVFFSLINSPSNAELLSQQESIFRQESIVNHEIKVILQPDKSRLRVIDSITLPKSILTEYTFNLHKGLKPKSKTSDVIIKKDRKPSEDLWLESFTITLPQGIRKFELEYAGVIDHPVELYGKEHARGFKQTIGLISEDGVYLSGGSYWYPMFGEEFVTFDLQIEIPPEWDAISQGARTEKSKSERKSNIRWVSQDPQDEIYLVAGQFTEYTKKTGNFLSMVFLRSQDKELAEKYLDATAQYLSMYEKLIGAYPYEKFALVENFWETGFGMPSFTLLGPKVVRFPFIIKSSYPHEILHSWWGNSVFPDYEQGNWAEGLTAYLSDHLLKEQEGKGAEHRIATLQKYTDYVLQERDFPLTEFRSRHSSASEAIGYGKSMMFFHMLRLQLGDEIFIRGLQEFYKKNKFHFASFTNLKKSFQEVSGVKLDKEFEQWIKRSGAPELKIGNINAVHTIEGGYLLKVVIEQVQPDDLYVLHVPIAVTLEGQKNAYQDVLTLSKRAEEFTINLTARPLRIDIDPEFDIFRRLNREEIPPAITHALGSKKMLVVLPASAQENMLRGYREFADILRSSGPDEVEVKLDKEISDIPSDQAVTLLGWENVFLKEAFSALSDYQVVFSKDILNIGNQKFQMEGKSVVLTARNPNNKNTALMIIATNRTDALSGLARKLPHYHKYSYLIFEGDEPTNIAKDRWPVLNSPMTAFIPDDNKLISRVDMGTLLPREPFAKLPPVFSSEKMLKTIEYLTSDTMQGRGFGSDGLSKAAEFIAGQFSEAGLKPLGDDPESYFQTWEQTGGEPERKVRMINVVGIIPGKKDDFSGQSVVVGTHYDHLGFGWPDARDGEKGKMHPGADDNASGVAVLIELARVLVKDTNPDRSIIFVAFDGEEAGKIGSCYYTKNRKDYPTEKCIAMLNLDTVGRLERKNIFVIGGNSAKEWPHIFRGAGYMTGVGIDMVSEELDSSDQISFQNKGVPAVQLFTGPHSDYHRPGDIPEKIDADGLVKVASVAKEVVGYLASRPEPLTPAIDGKEEASMHKQKRNVSLGIIPDFGFIGKGIRISGFVPNSPAEKSGLKEGDIILEVNDLPMNRLKDLSDMLGSLKPGDKLTIKFLRDEEEKSTEAELIQR